MKELLAALLIATSALTAALSPSPAHARRGGGSDFTHSPSYLRALEEGRRAYREQYLQQQRVYEPRKRRYRRR